MPGVRAIRLPMSVTVAIASKYNAACLGHIGYTGFVMSMYPRSDEILESNRRHIPGGMFSLNRATELGLVFVKGEGALLWDADGNRYIDYHGAFAPFILGHNDPRVNAAVEAVLHDGSSLFGVNTTLLEGQLAELI